ncbi:ABC transporter substrate-binding protein [Diplocloster hominis]|uniref:ABC transporter substrate-binding protein n=1 Tax=Diplocloster hominis TaxID=3079010 RepID=UPI0031BB49BF
MIRKRLCGLLALTAMIVMSLPLAGCQSKGTDASEPAAQEKAEEAVPAADDKSGEPAADAGSENQITDKEISFTWLHHLREEGKQAWVQYLVDTYQQKHPNVKINVELQTTDNYMTVLKTKVASGDAPMIFDLEPVYLTEFQMAGHLADVSDVDGLENFDADLLVEGQREGKQVGVPLDANGFCAFYNKEVFEKYDLKVPATISEFKQVCETLKDNGVTPIAVGFSEVWCMRRYSDIYTDVACVAKDKDWFTNKMNLSSKFSDDQAFKDAMNMFMSNQDYWGSDPYGTKWNDAMNEVATGEAAIAICGSWTIDGVLGINPDAQLGAFALPTSEDPSGAIMELKPGNSFCVYNSQDADMLAVAKDFFQFMCSQESAEYYAVNAHGITGCNIDIETLDALNDITAYEGDQLYVMSGVNGFTSEYQDIVFETLQSHAMNGSFDVDAYCADLDKQFASLN